MKSFVVTLCIGSLIAAHGFTQSAYKQRETKLFAVRNEETTGTLNRRRALAQFGQLVVGAGFLTVDSASAKVDSGVEADRQKLLKGYERLNYLLDHWEEKTTNCKVKTQYSSASNACERTPLVVQEYLGYKSMDDPLFKADKTFRRLEGLVSSDDVVDYLDAVERFNEKAEEGNGMAYISSWGEANPGGGKDRVEYFVERAKENVIIARDSLGTIIKILRIEA